MMEHLFGAGQVKMLFVTHGKVPEGAEDQMSWASILSLLEVPEVLPPFVAAALDGCGWRRA